MSSEYRYGNSELTQKLVKGVESLSRLREEDIQIGVTPKEEVYREDKVVLYRFTPKVEHSLNIPILIVYALVNRPYIVDLQEGRSLVANLLNCDRNPLYSRILGLCRLYRLRYRRHKISILYNIRARF